MSKKLRVPLYVIIGLIIVLLGAFITFRYILPPRSFPQVNGELQAPGLDGAVDIYRDAYGVPQIFATTEHDLFFAQGYVQAQDRFWQMDFWRHQSAGRLSELLGKNTLEIDQFIRTLGWERLSKEELISMDEKSLATLDAFSDGVNAYLSDHQGSALSLEYAVLPILNRDYKPAPWTPLNTVTWAKAMAWDLGGNMDVEITRAMLLKSLSSHQVDQLFPSYPADHPLIVPHPDIGAEPGQREDIQTQYVRTAFPAFYDLNERLISVNKILGGFFDGVGSNSWVISGKLTDTGMPYLANDPHLAAQTPSIWHEVGMHCAPLTPDCQFEVSGVSFAGVPGVVIGHNANVAWGFTNVGPDVMDLYIEKINPDNPNQYEYNGEWVDMQVIKEKIQIAGGDSQELTVRLTQHGPIITDVYDLETFDDDAGIDIPENYAIALRWTALEPSCIFCGIWKFNKASNWEEFRDAAKDFVVPAQNLVYADIEGNIGYQMPGNVPIRAEGHDGQIPVPGWTDEFEWQGYIPFENLPYAFNPPEGYIVTANNAVVGSEYPYLIAKNWDYGFRAQRIVDMLKNSPNPITESTIKKMQGDNKDLSAEVLVPLLLQLQSTDENVMKAQTLLRDWDYQTSMDSSPAMLFAAFWKNLLKMTYTDQLPDFYPPKGNSNWMEITRQLIKDPNDPWWDDISTQEVERRDDILAEALSTAVDELEKSLGKDPTKWAWGDLHTLTFYNQVMNNFPLINKLFNRGPFRTSGGSSIVNATGWNANQSYQVTWLPSMRMIVDMSNLQNSLLIHTTGESGHAYHPHYIDMADLWRNIQYQPMHWDQDVIENVAEEHLRLVP